MVLELDRRRWIGRGLNRLAMMMGVMVRMIHINRLIWPVMVFNMPIAMMMAMMMMAVLVMVVLVAVMSVSMVNVFRGAWVGLGRSSRRG